MWDASRTQHIFHITRIPWPYFPSLQPLGCNEKPVIYQEQIHYNQQRSTNIALLITVPTNKGYRSYFLRVKWDPVQTKHGIGDRWKRWALWHLIDIQYIVALGGNIVYVNKTYVCIFRQCRVSLHNVWWLRVTGIVIWKQVMKHDIVYCCSQFQV